MGIHTKQHVPTTRTTHSTAVLGWCGLTESSTTTFSGHATSALYRCHQRVQSTQRRLRARRPKADAYATTVGARDYPARRTNQAMLGPRHHCTTTENNHTRPTADQAQGRSRTPSQKAQDPISAARECGGSFVDGADPTEAVCNREEDFL